MADLETFITMLRSHREQRTGPGLYASDKVFALLDEVDRLRSIELNWQIDTLGGAIDASPRPELAPIETTAWESTTPAYRRFVTQREYEVFSEAVQSWYRPYRCSSCTESEKT